MKKHFEIEFILTKTKKTSEIKKKNDQNEDFWDREAKF